MLLWNYFSLQTVSTNSETGIEKPQLIFKMKISATYDPSSPVPSQFTQIVWKNTTQVGCGVAACSGALDSEVALLYVCEYYPAGNVIGQFK